MKKAVITVLGHDKVGIIARVCTFLSEANVNILDISQTIVGGYFDMVMVVDITGMTQDFDKAVDGLASIGESKCSIQKFLTQCTAFDGRSQTDDYKK